MDSAPVSVFDEIICDLELLKSQSGFSCLSGGRLSSSAYSCQERFDAVVMPAGMLIYISDA